MKSISNKLASLLLIAGAWVGSAAHAVQDLPGGPAVNQLNLHPPVTKIAEEQHFLHWMMLIICTVIFVAVFSVMFYSIYLEASPLQGREGCQLPRVGDG